MQPPQPQQGGYSGPYGPGGGYPPPPPPRGGGNATWIILIVGLIVIAGGTVLTLWLAGVFDGKGNGVAQSNAITGPAPAAAPVLGGEAAAACSGVLRQSEVAGAPPTPNNRLAVRAPRSVLWNATPVSPTTLRQYLDTTKVLNPRPVLITSLEPGVQPQVVQEVLQVIEQGLGCRPAAL